MKTENARNTIIFFVCCLGLLFLYNFLVLDPAMKKREAEQPAAAASKAERNADATVLRPDGLVHQDRRTALAASGARVPISTPTLQGSLSLKGGRIDDLFLKDYRETLDSPNPVELFRPQGAEHAYFAEFGWLGQNVPGGVPGAETPWRLTGGSTLTPTTPITLTWDNGSGLRFTRVVSIDDKYMFRIEDTVANLGTGPITIAPYGTVRRLGVPDDLGKQMILHEGAIGTFDHDGGYSTQQHKYKDWAKKPLITKESTGGWLGITDKYWLAALIPPQTETIQAEFRSQKLGDVQTQQANMMGEARTIQPGMQIEEVQSLFAGAKRNEILDFYEDTMDLPRFVYAIDWGFLFFLTRPIFMVLEFFYNWVGNFGVAILLLTVVTKLLLFPLANKAYESLSKMKTLQPKMEEIKKKHADDMPAQQQAMMAMYQKEKINPLAGCLPILVQIPVFYALYKVLFVTIEMRHAPFFGWIRDLSARDPSTIWNLFGAIPWDPATAPVIGGLLNGALHLGVLPLFYGLTMWLQMSMNPPAPDPVQRRIFGMMPFVFTFIMAPFAAGLLIYWAWNNVLSIIQQYFIMHRFKADNPIDSFLARFKKG